ncbi:MAG: bifunctional UDP-N-acetylglucosamine diphosphorylase/glucosamine-1-phosphate N-acetyltransferase GlmU [Bacteriovoracaceae bacterium]|nr:bifunctional UDP-N-acetylglucosamine diphosphorylase/glucosamine-1-phosphate N-acetyltransferase GlmU [Bacteriovoracaceae bacterium]
MKKTVGAAILAAGQGTRLKLSLPKPLAPALGLTLVDYSVNALLDFFKENELEGEITAVTGHMRERVEGHLTARYGATENIRFAVQKKQLGTADALRSYFFENPKSKELDYTIVMCADTPLIRESDLSILLTELENAEINGVAATFIAGNPKGYGRIVRGDQGFHIVEEKDASIDIRNIKEVNSGLYIFKTDFVLEHLDKVDCKNKSGEFYLTDLFQDHFAVHPVLFESAETFVGVNTLEQLEFVSEKLRIEKNGLLREAGVRFLDSKSAYIDWDVQIGEGTVVYPNVIAEGNTVIGPGVKLGAGSIVTNSKVESGVEVKAYSVLEECHIKADAAVGPFARLRPKSVVGEESKIGNFVEIKNTVLQRGVKISHLSYVGDAEIGEETNIGCGFITCNYDGANKHKTIIGKNTFIGSDSQTVAPVTIGDNCFVASSSTITNPMKNGAFAISRGKQVTKDGMAKRFLKTKK